MKQGNFENEEFIRVGTTLYKLVNQLSERRLYEKSASCGTT